MTQQRTMTQQDVLAMLCAAKRKIRRRVDAAAEWTDRARWCNRHALRLLARACVWFAGYQTQRARRLCQTLDNPDWPLDLHV